MEYKWAKGECTKERNRAMKSIMRKILTLSLCVCMLMSETAYAQDESTDSQEKVILEEQETETGIDEQKQQEETASEEQQNKEMEKENAEPSIALKGTPYDYDVETEVDAQYKDGKWIADLSSVIGKDKIAQVTPNTNMGNGYDLATGLVVLPEFLPSYITFYVGNPDEKDNVYYKADIIYESIGETINTFVIEKETDPKFTVDTSSIDIDAIYNDFGVGADIAATMICVSEENSITQEDFDNVAYLEEYIRKSGELLQRVYPRVGMALYVSNGDVNWIKDNFGSITLSFDAGIENAGKTATVYQLYDANITIGKNGELIPYNNLIVDSNGMVTITTTKLTKSAFAIALQNLSVVSHSIKTNTNTSEVKADISRINADAVYRAFGIDVENTDAEIIVEQKEADAKNKESLTSYAKKFGDEVLKVYDVVMNLYADSEYKGTVTDNFGSLTLSFYAGTEYVGKKAVVYQLHEDNVITHKDLTIDANGMVTITVSKLSTFAVALQNQQLTTSVTNVSPSPRTGDSANMILWFVLAIFAMSVISVTVKRQRR